MSRKKVAAAVLGMAIFGITSLVYGQGSSAQGTDANRGQSGRSLPLIDSLDELGQSLFGRLLPAEKPPSSRSTPRTTAKRASNGSQPSERGTPWSGGGVSSQRPVAGPSDVGNQRAAAPRVEYPRPAGSRPPAAAPRSGTTATGQSPSGRTLTAVASGPTPEDDEDEPETPLGPPTSASAPSAANTPPHLRPLHERLTAFRQSAFAPPAATQADLQAAARAATDPPSVAASKPGAVVSPSGETRARAGEPTMAVPDAAGPGRPVIVPRSVPSARVGTAPGSPGATDGRPSGRLIAGARANDAVLIARKGPVLSVQTLGPRRILVGRESIYEITIVNAGETAAEEVIVRVNLPVWAELAGTEASSGTAEVGATSDAVRPLQWRVGQLPASAKERLVLQIIPRESRPIDLAVRWEYTPAVSQTVIEVQEPKLAMRLEGPRELLYGKKELFTLKLANTGTGDAENVVLTLMPMTSGDSQPVLHTVGLVAAGEEKALEVELTARQPGNMTVQVSARGEAGVHAELSEKVLVRRAALQAEIEGPQVQYVGAVASYRIRVSNPGTAPAQNVRVSASIPPGGKYLSGIEGARLEANGTKLQWTLATLNPGGEQSYSIKCSLGLPGASKVEVVSVADDDLSASSTATTRVEALADLVLDLKDPGGPVPLDEEAAYELRIRNRGTKSAEGVDVVVFFSRGVEPVAAEGGPHQLAAGQVVFQPIAAIAAGSELVLKVRARAGTAGNHSFRAEVHCKPLGTRLVSERTTHFYQDGAATGQAARPSPLGASPPQVLPPQSTPPATLPPIAPLRTADPRQATPAPYRAEPTPAPVRR